MSKKPIPKKKESVNKLVGRSSESASFSTPARLTPAKMADGVPATMLSLEDPLDSTGKGGKTVKKLPIKTATQEPAWLQDCQQKQMTTMSDVMKCMMGEFTKTFTQIVLQGTGTAGVPSTQRKPHGPAATASTRCAEDQPGSSRKRAFHEISDMDEEDLPSFGKQSKVDLHHGQHGQGKAQSNTPCCMPGLFDDEPDSTTDEEREIGSEEEREVGSDKEREVHVGSDEEREIGSDEEREVGSDEEREVGSDEEREVGSDE